ncbi:MAG: alanine racemase, partial [Actinoplanes sp.]
MSLLLSDPRATLQVDLDAVTANVRTIKSRTAGELMAVVKADGFGHGQVDVARAALAGGATRLGVTSIDEARPLRAAGLTEPILSWLNPLHAD